jgi:hypothetical protein
MKRLLVPFFVPKDSLAHNGELHLRRLRAHSPECVDQINEPLSGADLADCANQKILVPNPDAFPEE